MNSTFKGIIAGAFALALTAGAASAQMMQGGKMMGMMQCSSACSQQYMQCMMSANQLASTPSEGMAQMRANMQSSMACNQAAMACNASCR